jgi:hypothetical protein
MSYCTAEEEGETQSSLPQSSSSPQGRGKKPHPIKGGWCITDYLTYDWYVLYCVLIPIFEILFSLLDEGAQTSEASYLSRVWTCPVCEVKLAVNMAEQLQHQASCTKEMDDAIGKTAAPSLTQDPTLLKDYYCAQCGDTLQLTATNILKHKRDHAMNRTT